jgi:predicted nucleotidyltransferase
LFNGMDRIINICNKYHIALCYLFGSQKEQGLARLHGADIEVEDQESDIDFGVWFISPPKNTVDTYAKLSLELGELLFPFRIDLVFLHEVDHLLQFEAIQGLNIFAINDMTKDAYESNVMAFAGDETVIFKKNEKDFLEAVRDGYFEFKYQANPR